MERIELLDDRVLVKRIEERSALRVTDKPKSIKGVILSVGPGKWHPGEWWKVPARGTAGVEQGNIGLLKVWEWFPGYRETPQVKVGDYVLFNSRWNDLAHAENKGTGADLKGPLERPLSYKLDPLTHLIREADIFCICPPETRAQYIGTAVEEKFFRNASIAEECFQSK